MVPFQDPNSHDRVCKRYLEALENGPAYFNAFVAKCSESVYMDDQPFSYDFAVGDGRKLWVYITPDGLRHQARLVLQGGKSHGRAA